MEQEQMIPLLDRYLAGTATEAEQLRIDAWLDSMAGTDNEWERMTETERANYISSLYQKIKTSIHKEPLVVPIYRRKIFKWIAAASIILVMGYGLWVTRRESSDVKRETVAKTNDVPAPSNTRAVITLANGQKVYLDSASNGTIAQENNANVVKNEKGEIVYNSTSQSLNNSTQYNTLFNPRGSKVISLTLSDGSHVWLNSGSSIKYPVAFISKERKVEITGEAYFEVAHNAAKPFIVSKGETSVTVLGTHFNVNAYDDEDALRVTLLEGSVKVTQLSPAGGGGLNDSPNNKRPGVDNSVVIKPNQQAVIIPQTRVIRVQNNVDVDEVMAWKNGMFSFESADVQTIMRVLARWYDLEVVYEGKQMNEQLHVEASRNTSLQNVLKVLEMTSKMRFKIEGKKVIVSP